jgi:nucleoside phosphorylase
LRALTACSELHRRQPDLKTIILIGFAGALTTDLKIGDLIEPSLFVEQDYNAEPFEKFPNQILKNKHRKLLSGSRDAVMLTQDRFLTENPYRDRPAGRGYKTIACDMESYAVAYYCRRMKIQYTVAKLISDCADETADHDFLKACRDLSPKLNRATLELLEQLS